MFNFKKIAACAAAAMTLACSVTAMPTSAGTEPFAYIKGDVNGDGRVTMQDHDAIVDIIMARKAPSNKSWGAADVNFDHKVDPTDFNIVGLYLKTGQLYANGDVDGDNKVTKKDVKAIADYVNGKRPFFKKQIILSDVNKNNMVTAKDYMLIRNYHFDYSK